MSFLKEINSPKDLKKLSPSELQNYSDELRAFMISTMSEVGGHVAANLGVVELTVALHTVFNTPQDKLVWDVGHQCYAHKIITGRRDQFHTIRQEGGISGFTKISESPYDCFGAGHSSTSVSAGVGFAEAEFQNGTDNLVLSVIGDGALTAGMAYEGLNHAGHLRRPNYIVIFNDNEMSISENVGALAKFFSKRVTSSLYNRLRAEVKAKLKAISHGEIDLYDHVKSLSSAVKDLFTASSFFEALGFRYVGPVDGHDLPELIKTFQSVKGLAHESMDELRRISEMASVQKSAGLPQDISAELGASVNPPILIHVRTKKGFGLSSAEKNPGDFHGVAGFCKDSGLPTKKPTHAPSYTSIFASTVTRMAETDSKIVAVTAAMPEGTGLNLFQKKFPTRFYDVGIAEQHAVTFSAALRLGGLKPVVAIYSTFLQRAYDQVIHDVAIQKIPLTFFIDRAGLVGADGPTHHGIFDMSFLRCVPGMHILAPKDENELQHAVYTAIKSDKLIAVRFPRGEGLGVPLDQDLKMLPLGVSEKVIKLPLSRVDVCIWAAGSCVQPAVKAASLLKDHGLQVEVVNARFIKPLDTQALLSDAQRTRLIVSVEENAVIGGLGDAVLEELSKNHSSVAVLNLGVPDEFIEHGNQAKLRAYCHIDADGIYSNVLKKLAVIAPIEFSKLTQGVPPEQSTVSLATMSVAGTQSGILRH